jgi:hypothetical protein
MCWLRSLKFEKAVTFPTVSFVCTVALSPRVKASKFSVTVQQIQLRILFVLPQGPVVWEQFLTADTIRHWVIVAWAQLPRAATQASHTMSLLRFGVGGLRKAYSKPMPRKRANGFWVDSDEHGAVLQTITGCPQHTSSGACLEWMGRTSLIG